MFTTFCTNCGAPLDTTFCSECGARAPKPSPDIDATFVRWTPLAPRSVEFPPPMVIPGVLPTSITPEPTVALPPLYAPPPELGRRVKPDRAKMWLTIGAAVALVGAISVALAVGGSSHPPAADARPSDLVTPSSTTSSTALPTSTSTSSSLEPGTRSALVPSWANKDIGRLVRAQIVLGATGTAVFASPGHNTCAVLGSEVSCVAMPLWHQNDLGVLPPLDPSCSSTPDGRWSVFTVGSTGLGTAVGCSTTPTALTLGTGTAPHNKVIGMGATGILCYIDARKGAPSSESGVACWNPATNHGLMITNQDMRLW